MNATLRTSLIPLTLVALSLSGPASSQSMPGHAGHTMPAQSGAAQSGAAHAGHAMTGLSELGALRGRAFDRAYLSMMIPHHQAAVEMARAALAVSRDATVKAWATADIYRGVVPFIAIQLLVLALCMVFPGLTGLRAAGP